MTALEVKDNIFKAIETSRFALQRLSIVLLLWNDNKCNSDYQWLYICARDNGVKLGSIWINQQENATKKIECEFADNFSIATSFEIEFLHTPKKCFFNLDLENQRNSLRGKQAMFIEYAGKTKCWASLEMIACNISFNKAIKKHINDVNTVEKNIKQIPVTLFKTKQFFCDNSSIVEGVLPVQMFRGNTIIELNKITKSSVLKATQRMSRWLMVQISDNGHANYKYWPSRGESSLANNAIRQWMATVCLNRVATFFDVPLFAEIAKRNLAYNLSTTYLENNDLGYIWMDGSAKLGAAALAALAMFESPNRKSYSDEEGGVFKLIRELTNSNGSFDTFLIPRERTENQNFYSGEALLYLAIRFSVNRDPNELRMIMSSFYYYRNWHREKRNPAFIPWHTQAYFIIWKITKDIELESFIFEMNDWLLGMQQWETTECPDMKGRFYDPKRAYYGPPHASSTGVYLEGLIDAFELAKECQDCVRIQQYRKAIVRGIRSIIQLQFKGEEDCFYIKNVNRVHGGVRTTVYDNTIRIDNVQHPLMAFIKILNCFDENDYILREKL